MTESIPTEKHFPSWQTTIGGTSDAGAYNNISSIHPSLGWRPHRIPPRSPYPIDLITISCNAVGDVDWDINLPEMYIFLERSGWLGLEEVQVALQAVSGCLMADRAEMFGEDPLEVAGVEFEEEW